MLRNQACIQYGKADNLSSEYHRYICSHRNDILRALDVPRDVGLVIHKTSGFERGRVDVTETEVQIAMGEDEMRLTLATARTFQWANGVVIIPTLASLLAHGAIPDDAPEPIYLRDVAERLLPGNGERNLGNLFGAFRLLGLQGWLVTEGANRDARFVFSDVGRSVLRQARLHWESFAELASEVGHLAKYHAYFHCGNCDASVKTMFERQVDRSLNGWGMSSPCAVNPVEARARGQLRALLDGLLAGPVMVALGMPVYEKHEDRIRQVRPAIFDRFDSEGRFDASKLVDCDPDLLRTAFRLMAHHGILECCTTDTTHRLTDTGRAFAQVCPSMAALPVSYLKSYERLPDVLFGNPDPLGIAVDGHVDRAMNVFASSRAGSGPASKEICEKILVDLFDNDCFDQQPAGIADMGCGDATALMRMADFIIMKTKRGKHLDRYPLAVIAADYNTVSLDRARETLSCYANYPGVAAAVVQADVTLPHEYDQAVRRSGIHVRDQVRGVTRPLELRDLLHTFMFIVHNRKLRLSDENEARAVIETRALEVGHAGLSRSFSGYLEKELPTEKESMLAEVFKVFRTAYSNESGFVSGVTQAADLVLFMHRWKPYIHHGFVALEGHSPWDKNLKEDVPDDPGAWMRVDKLPHPFNWGMHFLSRQYMMPFQEYILAMRLADFEPAGGAVFGQIGVSGLPDIDVLPQYRFFSIACYRPCSVESPHV